MISTTSPQVLTPTESSAGDTSREELTGAWSRDGGSSSELPFLCSVKGNCSCLFEDFDVIVVCTSVGNKLDEIANELPSTTTHL